MDVITVDKLVSEGNVRSEEGSSLADSIAAEGVLCPIVIYPLTNGMYGIKDGHRRVSALRALGWNEIPCVVVPQVNSEVDEIIHQIVMNNQREAIGYLDMARTFAVLKGYGMKQKDIADRLGTTAANVSLALAALEAHPKLQEAVANGRLAPSAVEPLLPLPLEVQERLADTAIRLRTVRKITDLVETEKRKLAHAEPTMSPNQESLEESVEEEDALGVLVLTALETAITDLSTVADFPITDPTLKQRGRLAVKELVELAKQMEKSF